MSDNIKPKRNIKKKNLMIGIVMVIGGIIGSYSLISWNDNINTQVDMLMSHIDAKCYVYFPSKNDSNVSDAQVAYYKSMVEAMPQNGVKYVGAFLRSPAFNYWLFNNCPMYNGTQPIYQLKAYNASLADTSEKVQPSKGLVDAVKQEQSMLNYQYRANPDNFTRIEYVAAHFNSTLQSTIDNMLMSGALNINGTVFKNGTSTGNIVTKKGHVENAVYIKDPKLRRNLDLYGLEELDNNTFSECHDPSWNGNSLERQCSIYGSMFTINLQNQDIMAIYGHPVAGLNVH